MGGAVFAHPNGVMSEDIDDRYFHDRRQSHGRTRIIAEDHEARAKRANLAERKPVQDGAHGMLAYTEMEVASGVTAGFKIAGAIEGEARFGGRSQVGRTADQPRNVLRNRV